MGSSYTCNKNTEPLKDVQETTSLSSLVIVYKTNLGLSKRWLKPTHPWAWSPKKFASKLRLGQVWLTRGLQFPHVTPTPAANSCSFLWSDTMYVSQLLHPSSKQQLSLGCFCTVCRICFALVGFNQDSSLGISQKCLVGSHFDLWVGVLPSRKHQVWVTEVQCVRPLLWSAPRQMIGLFSDDFIVRVGAVGYSNESTCQWVSIPFNGFLTCKWHERPLIWFTARSNVSEILILRIFSNSMFCEMHSLCLQVHQHGLIWQAEQQWTFHPSPMWLLYRERYVRFIMARIA